ncbi:MAG: Hpt domain-containing protein [Candidatus Parcubacteria bacterium]|nr:Hpt domain-containing protein [Candidatus Parcubacteria bacterium]
MDEQVKDEVMEILQEINHNFFLLKTSFFCGQDFHEAIHSLYSGFHTLKGIFGLVGLSDLNLLSTIWQDFFKLLQVGKVKLVPEAVDFLAQSLEQLKNVLEQKEPEAQGEIVGLNIISCDLARLIEKHKVEGRSASEKAELFQAANVTDEVIGALSEKEESRLEANIENGKGLCLILVSYSLSDFDDQLRQFQTEAKSLGEVICLQPIEAACPEEIAFKILFATTSSLEMIAQGFSVAIRDIWQLREVLGNDVFFDEGVAGGF